jgi:hypothetical protein
MALGPARLAGGRNLNEIGLGRALFWRGRWLQEVLQHRVFALFLLRVGGLLEGGIVALKLESVTFHQTPRRSIVRRPETRDKITTR